MSERDWSRATRESLVALASCYLGPDDDRTRELIGQAADRLRAEVEPRRRTRAEVDAELCADIREYMRLRYQVDGTTGDQLQPIWARMSELCSEPTRDEPIKE